MRHLFRILFGSLLGLALVACHGPQDQARANQARSNARMELKIYEVPPQRTNDLRNALNATISSKSIRVTTAAPGKLMVYAPRGTQESIDTVIAELVKAAPDDVVPATLQVHFWIVDAVPGAGNDDPALAPLAGTLETLRKSHGPLHFTLKESISAAATLDRETLVDTGKERFFQFTARAGQAGAINLSAKYVDNRSLGIRSINTTVAMKPAQYVVLVQAPDGAVPSPGTMRLLVVRVDRQTSARH
jgi:hypothetical protein